MATKDSRVELLDKMYDEAKQASDLISKERSWDTANELIRGKQAPPDRPPYKPEAVLNMIRPLIERKMAALTDTKPRFTVVPTCQGEKWAKSSKLLDEVANAWWDDQIMDMRIARGLFYAQAFGTMVTQTRWDKASQEVIVDIVDPRNFYVDPYILTPEQLCDAEYVCYEEVVSLDYVKATFGSAAKEVTPWVPPGSSKESTGGFVSRIAKRLTGPYGQRNTKSAVQRALLRHFWIKDYKTEKVEVTKEGKTVEIVKRLYPGGRYLVWAHDGVILHDKPNPYADLTHPFDMLDWYMDLDSPWGDSEVCAHKSPQLLLNKLAEVLVENAMLMNNAIWICDMSAFPATDGPEGWGQLTNAPGAIIKKRPGTEVKREYPGGAPGSSIQLLQHLEKFTQEAGGTPDVLTKGKAGNVQSGLGIEQMQMNAAAMIRLKARGLEQLISRLGQKYISRVIQFYPESRMFHIMGPKDEFREYLWIRKNFRDALDAASLLDAHKNFRFKVAPGSSLNLTKIQRGIMAVQLHQMGLVSGLDVLHAVDWPNAKEAYEQAIKEQVTKAMLGGGQQKGSKKGKSAGERQMKIAGRT